MQNQFSTMNFATNIFYQFFMLVVERMLVVQNRLLLFVKFVRRFWTRREDLPQLQEESSFETRIKVEDLLMLTCSSMERLGNDQLFTIFTHIHNPNDQISFAQVSKQFLKVACHHLIKLHISFPDFLYDVLPASPNLISFTCSKPLSNTHMKLLAQYCPKLKHLKLGLDQSFDHHQVESNVTSSGSKSCSHLYGQSDFDDDGLCSIANSCSNLRRVDLRKRLNVGDVAIVTLVRSSKCLKALDLWGCVNVTNKSLKAIGESNLHGLSLQGCHLITDLGLKYLVNGNVRNHLIEIVVAECDGITDAGIIDLKQMKCKHFVIRSKEITQSILEGFGNSFHFLNNLTFHHG